MSSVHLIVLVHGMWGNVHHFDYMREQLIAKGAIGHERGAFDSSQLNPSKSNIVVYCTRTNEGYFTYDGIDVCGTRAAAEINNEIDALAAAGATVDRLSLIGYSMGGVIIRYAAGILYTEGLFERVKPEIFTTFCSPHVGVTLLGSRMSARSFNFIGSWSMARTSRQVFLKDSYEKTGTPLFKHLTDQGSPFMKALALFNRRVLYANIANDRRCDYYTAAIEDTDPFVPSFRLRALCGPFAGSKYAPVVLNSTDPDFHAEGPSPSPSSERRRGWGTRLASYILRVLRITKFSLKVAIVIPIWFVAFLLNAAYQTTVSTLRTRKLLSARGHIPSYEVSDLLEEEADHLVEQAYNTIADPRALQVTPLMRKIVDQLNSLRWEKYPIHITADPNAHAAAIVRLPKKKSYWEGKVVISHWIEQIMCLV